MFILCKHRNLKELKSNITVKQEMGTVTKQEYVSEDKVFECTCNLQWYTIYVLTLSLLCIIGWLYLILEN